MPRPRITIMTAQIYQHTKPHGNKMQKLLRKYIKQVNENYAFLVSSSTNNKSIGRLEKIHQVNENYPHSNACQQFTLIDTIEKTNARREDRQIGQLD